MATAKDTKTTVKAAAKTVEAKEAPKAAAPKKEAAPKAEAPKKEAAPKKETAPKAAAPKKEAAPKKAAAKKAEMSLHVQYPGVDITVDDIYAKVLAGYTNAGNDAKAIDKFDAYLNVNENKVYYVINGVAGSVDL